MKLELKELFCTEWALGREIELDSKHNCWVHASIGVADEDWSEEFTITVCNTDFVREYLKHNSYFSGLWVLITEDPSREIIETYISEMLRRYSIYDDWETTRTKIRLMGAWQSEDNNDYTVESFMNDVAKGDIEKVKVLIEFRLSVNKKYFSDSRTALMHAINNGQIEMARVLIKLGADVDIKNRDGSSALDLARLYHHNKEIREKMIKLLKEAGTNEK